MSAAMNPQTHPVVPVVTLFLKPSFNMTAQGSGLQVAVTAQQPKRPN